MRLAPVVISVGAAPVDLAFLKAHAVINFSDDDDLLQSYLDAAIEHLDGPDGIMGRACRPQTVRQSFSAFCYRLDLPYGSVNSLTSVTYFDQDDVEQTLTDGVLYRDFKGSFVHFPETMAAPVLADRPDALTVTYDASFYANSPDISATVKVAIARIAATWYDNRDENEDGPSKPLPYGVQQMLAPLRRVRL